MHQQRRQRRFDPTAHRAPIHDIATVYDQAGEDYIAYADGDPERLFCFDGLHAYADRRLWSRLETMLNDRRRAGATSINSVTFGLSDPNVARGRATAKAVAEARANAEAVARAADLHIVGIKSIELTGAPSAPMPLMRAAAMPNSPTEFDQSNVSVTVSVSVVFSASP